MGKKQIDIKIENDNTDKILLELALAKKTAFEIIGMNAEKYAKALCPVGTPESTGYRDKNGKLHPNKGYRGGTLRDSITHNSSDQGVVVGSNVEYAPYVELGTGPFFAGAPDWVEVEIPTPKGTGTSYVHPRPYLRPAIENHLSEYKSIIEQELKS